MIQSYGEKKIKGNHNTFSTSLPHDISCILYKSKHNSQYNTIKN